MNRVMSGAEPFFFPGNRTGCLLIHGFTGTPFEMREMGEHLAGQGFSVLGPRLFAHATSEDDLLRARWPDWLASVEDGYDLLSGVCDRIIPIGLSMGGLLALVLSSRRAVPGAVAMSTPFHPPDPRMRPLRALAPLLTRVWRFAAKGTPDWRDPQAMATHLEYPRYPLRGAVELYDLIGEMRASLPRLTCPVLIIQSRHDGAVPAAHATELQAHLATSDKEIVWLDNSGHAVTRDAERGRVFAAATSFVRRVSGEPA